MKLSTLGYIIKDDKILFLYRNKKKGDLHIDKYNGIGGKMEIGESPEQCMKREAKEEAGIDILKMDFHGIITFPDFMGSDDWYMFVYKIEEYSGEIKAECNEGTFVWKNIKEILDLNIWEGDKIFLKWLINNEKIYSAKFYYKKGLDDEYVFTGYFSKFY